MRSLSRAGFSMLEVMMSMTLLTIFFLAFVTGTTHLRKQMGLLGNHKSHYLPPPNAQPAGPNPTSPVSDTPSPTTYDRAVRSISESNAGNEEAFAVSQPALEARSAQLEQIAPPSPFDKRRWRIELDNGWQFDVESGSLFFLRGGKTKTAREVVVGDRVVMLNPAGEDPLEAAVKRIEELR